MRNLMMTVLLVLSCTSLALAQDDYHKFEVSAGYSHMFADGILGDGELFADDPDGSLDAPEVPDFFTNPAILTSDNIFTRTPFVNTGNRHRPGLNGFNATATYNFSKYVGVKFEVSGHHRSSVTNVAGVLTTFPYDIVNRRILPLQASFPPGTVRGLLIFGDSPQETRQRHYNFLGGVQLKNNSKEKKFKPFAHVLAGVSRQTVEFKDFIQSDFALFGEDKFTNTGFTMAFGGGIDIRLSRRIDLRVIQVDYNPVRIKEQQILAFRQGITNTGIPNNLSFTNLETATIFSFNDVRINSRWQNNFRIGVGIVFH